MAGAANPSVQYLLSPSYAFLDPGYASLLLPTHIFLGLDVFLAQETTFNAPQGPSENWQCVPEWEREVGGGGVCCSSTVFVRSLRVHLYGVGTHSLSLSQPLTTAICNAVMWSTVSLCPLPTQTHARANLTVAQTSVYTQAQLRPAYPRHGVTVHTTTNEHILAKCKDLIVGARVFHEIVVWGFYSARLSNNSAVFWNIIVEAIRDSNPNQKHCSNPGF